MMLRLNPSEHGWMTALSTNAVMDALDADGGGARFVGGAVRNALLGEKVGDIDIATPLTPDEVIRRLTRAGLGAVPTGIAHGTITAISSGKPFEITTLRRDVSTDGRRATIAFTDRWDEDASRRDFTMNAIYAARDGTLFDPTGGQVDIAERRVRFVGDAATRIREDYLRALRLFRFHAWYGRGPIDATALAAARTEKAGLKTLSGERVQKELFRLLQAPDPIPTLQTMESAGILAEILPQPLSIARLSAIRTLLAARGRHPIPAVSLMAMLPNEEAARRASTDLRLSNADRDRLMHIAKRDDGIEASLSQQAARHLIYRLGAARFEDELLLEASETPHDSRWDVLLSEAENWKAPKFPLDGRDAMDAGASEGPAIGRSLKAVEEWWAAENFAPTRPALLRKLKEFLAAGGA